MRKLVEGVVKQASALRSGEWVEVRSAAEILATLDDEGRLESLPFMPEMLQYCGRRFRVLKSAHKTCDTIQSSKGRRMTHAVHLEGLRCDGQAHGGCQAACLLFWKEAWLTRVSGPGPEENRGSTHSPTPIGAERATSALSRCDTETLARATRVEAISGETAPRYRCQATELLKATTPLPWWQPGQYLKDWRSRNVRLGTLIWYMLIAAYNVVMRLHWRGRPYPYIRGLAGDRTPTEELNLQPGEIAQVRSKQEIMLTLNARQRNRGLWFDAEMVRYCGKSFKVLARVDKIINEKTGAMMRMPNPCVILDGVSCSGCLSRDRLFCPRGIYPFWHEVWLRRVNQSNAE
jgi:hypothetical protein